jgi:E3 ubiquitin-protein ligase HERC2
VYSEVFAWGQCGQGQFGLGSEVLADGKKLEPTAIDELKYIHIKALAAAPEHTVVAASGGEAYSCGNCDNGKLGHKTAEMDEMDDVFEGSSMHRFCMINALKYENMSGIEGELMDMTCGREFTCAWTTGGHVYTWGEGSNGKLCHQDNNSKKLPHKISALREKKVPAGRAACGYDHILMITSSADYGEVGKEFGVTIAGGLVMAAGGNNGGQLGTNDPNARPQWTPQMLDPKLRSNMDGSVESSTMFGGSSALQMAAGQMHSMCRAGGKVWTWGFGVDGQLGHEKPPPIPGRPAFMQPRFMLLEPKAVEGITKMVVEIACGANFSMCLCDDGSVYTWGKNDKGQLGLGDTDVHEQPVKVIGLAGKGIKKLCGGECHALALTKDGQERLSRSAV